MAEARLRCALSSVLCARGRAREAAAEASLVLAQPQLPGDLRDAAITAQLQALAGLRGEGAESAIAPVLAAPDRFDGRARGRRAGRRRRHGAGTGAASTTGLSCCGTPSAGRRGSPLDARHLPPLLALAAALVDVRQLDQAEEILAGGGHTSRSTAPRPGRRCPSCAPASTLAGGQLTAAAAAAEEALAVAESLGADGHASAAHCVLGLIALRRWRPDRGRAARRQR